MIDAQFRYKGSAPFGHSNILKASRLDTPLGPLLAMGNDEALYLLEFVDRRGLERKVERLRQRTQSAIIPGEAKSITVIKAELGHYFAGNINHFQTPLCLLGSPFQNQVWEELRKIPPGETRSYSAIAQAIGKPTACRAVAGANGANPLNLIIPCHRVINTGGQLGGYGGGVMRKKWLLDHEKHFRGSHS